MKTFLGLLFTACVLANVGCGGSMSVQQDWDPDYSFADIDAYAWLPIRSTRNIGESRLKRLVAAINAEMAAKQLVLTAEEPDILLELHVTSEKLLDLNQYGTTARWNKSAGDSGDLDKGSVMVDVQDAKTRVVVWRVVADGKVDPSATPEEQTERFTKLAKKLFEKFPPMEK